MAGRTEAEAVENFRAPLTRALSCVTNEYLSVGGGYHSAASPHVLTLGDGGPVRLRGEASLALLLSQQYRIVEEPGPRGPWRVQTAGYIYALEMVKGEFEGNELIAFHWHPQTGLSFPHTHLGAASGVRHEALAKQHLPSGRVSIEEVLRLAIALGTEPLRKDWEDVLDETETAYEAVRSWPSSPPP